MTLNINDLKDIKLYLKEPEGLLDHSLDLKNNIEILQEALLNGYPLHKIDPKVRLKIKIINAAYQALLNGRVPFTPMSPLEPAKILLGSPKNKHILEKIKSALAPIQGKSLVVIDRVKNGSPYLRDAGVVRPDQQFAIAQKDPTNWNNKDPADYGGRDFFLCLPEYQHSLIPSDQGFSYMGRGGTREAVAHMALCTHYLGTPYFIQNTFIEGGNCYIFIKENVNYAIVGEFSLFLNFLKFKYSGELPCNHEYTGIPSQIAYLIAHRFHLKETHPKLNWDSFLEMLSIPLKMTPELEMVAKTIESQLLWTKQQMANALGISYENMILIPQRSYHIDLELTVTPEGVIILHDEEQSLKILKDLEIEKDLYKQERRAISDLIRISNNNIESHKNLVETTIKRLEEKGLKVILKALSFSSDKFQFHLNYANGIFENATDGNALKSVNMTYFTTGPTYFFEKKIHQRAIASLQDSLQGMPIIAIESISNFIYSNKGGLRCLTIQFQNQASIN